jgi:hypothetical protein
MPTSDKFKTIANIMNITIKHLIYSSSGLPLNAFQLIIINPSIPVNIPHIAVDAPIESLFGLTTDEKRVPPILKYILDL